MSQLARRVVTLLVLAMILPTAVVHLGPLLAAAIGAHLRNDGLFGDFLGIVLVLVFVAGLAARAGGAGEEETAEQRRARLTVRRPVEDDGEDEPLEEDDDDPIVPWNEEEE